MGLATIIGLLISLFEFAFVLLMAKILDDSNSYIWNCTDGCPYYYPSKFVFIVHIFNAIFYSAILAIHFLKMKRRSLTLLLMYLIGLQFLFSLISILIFGKVEGAKCALPIIYVLFSITFPLVLYHVIQYDIQEDLEKSEREPLFSKKMKTISSIINEEKNEVLEFFNGNLDETVMRIPLPEIVKLKRVGAGGFGEVWKGYWKSEKNVIALKSILKMDKEHMNIFLREINMMSKLNHPNICEFIGVSIDKDCVFLITEFVERGSLFDIIHDGVTSLSQNIILGVLHQTILGMNYLHDTKPVPILHRDLKSQNLLIGNNWQVKICDFGMSREFSNDTMTKLGTLQWVAPEVLRNEKYSERADVYSFGILIWEMIVRKIPYSGKKVFEVANKVAFSNLRPKIPNNVNPTMKKMMEDCWADVPAERPTFHELQDKIELLQKK